MTRFLIDESVGQRLVKLLREQGHDVASIIESMPGASDARVLSKAVNERRLLVTNDKDFGELVYRRKLKHSGIILLRLTEAAPEAIVRLLGSLTQRHGERLSSSFTVVTEDRVKFR